METQAPLYVSADRDATLLARIGGRELWAVERKSRFRHTLFPRAGETEFYWTLVIRTPTGTSTQAWDSARLATLSECRRRLARNLVVGPPDADVEWVDALAREAYDREVSGS